jgi:hypothetical protein
MHSISGRNLVGNHIWNDLLLWGLERLGQPIAVSRHKLLKLLVQKWAVFKHFYRGSSTHLCSGIFAKKIFVKDQIRINFFLVAVQHRFAWHKYYGLLLISGPTKFRYGPSCCKRSERAEVTKIRLKLRHL